MALALGLLVLWLLVFAPVGLVVHALVLGEGSRRRALPLAPVTGVAVGIVLLGLLHAVGVTPADRWLPVGFVVMYVVSLLTPAPSKALQDLIDDVRMPRGKTIMEEKTA